jgi:hypothetical protein
METPPTSPTSRSKTRSGPRRWSGRTALVVHRRFEPTLPAVGFEIVDVDFSQSVLRRIHVPSALSSGTSRRAAVRLASSRRSVWDWDAQSDPPDRNTKRFTHLEAGSLRPAGPDLTSSVSRSSIRPMPIFRPSQSARSWPVHSTCATSWAWVARAQRPLVVGRLRPRRRRGRPRAGGDPDGHESGYCWCGSRRGSLWIFVPALVATAAAGVHAGGLS